jgi:glycosyltransferase involved in cell wall biosynthesis
MDVSVIIPTRNRWPLLDRCLVCLDAQTFPADRCEIVVVDDASTDGTVARLRGRSSRPRLTVLTMPDRRGPSAARNVALRAASGTIAVFLDDDAFAPPWFVAEHVAVHAARPRHIVDGPAITITPPDQAAAPPFLARTVRAQAALDCFGRCFVTVNASCPREAAIACGGFDEAMWGWEDVDLGFRLMAAGFRRVRHRRAYVLHCKGGPLTAEAEWRLQEERGYFAGVFWRKHPSAAARRLIRRRYLRYERVLSVMLPGNRGGNTSGAGVLPHGPRAVLAVRAYACGLARALRGEPRPVGPPSAGHAVPTREPRIL